MMELWKIVLTLGFLVMAILAFLGVYHPSEELTLGVPWLILATLRIHHMDSRDV